MNNNGITIGSAVTGIIDLGGSLTGVSGGSYVRISGTGIILNSNANLTVSTNNVVIDSTATGSSTMFRLGGSSSPALLYTPSGGLSVTGALTATSLSVGSGNNMLTYQNGVLTIKGNMTATSGTIGGWTIGSDYIGNANTKNGSTIGMVNASADTDGVFWAGGAYNGSPNFKVTK